MELDYVEIEELTSMLTSTAKQVLGGPAGEDYANSAEDLAQEVILALLEYEGQGNPFTLGKTILHRRCLTHKERELRRREIESQHKKTINRDLTGQSAESLAADPYEIMAYEEMKDRLDNLSPLIYNTVQSYYIDGLSASEIAYIDEVSIDVVYKRLQRARDEVTGNNNND